MEALFESSWDETSNDAIQETITSYFEVYIKSNLSYLIKKLGYPIIKIIIDDLLFRSSPEFEAHLEKYGITSEDRLILDIFDRLINGRLESIEPLMAHLKKINNKPTLKFYNDKTAKIMGALFERHMSHCAPMPLTPEKAKATSDEDAMTLVARRLFT